MRCFVFHRSGPSATHPMRVSFFFFCCLLLCHQELKTMLVCAKDRLHSFASTLRVLMLKSLSGKILRICFRTFSSLRLLAFTTVFIGILYSIICSKVNVADSFDNRIRRTAKSNRKRERQTGNRFSAVQGRQTHSCALLFL